MLLEEMENWEKSFPIQSKGCELKESISFSEYAKDVFPDDLFYSFYYDFWQMILVYKKEEIKMFEQFYEQYATEEREVLVLIQKCLGAGYHSDGDFWNMTATLLGMVFCDTGEVHVQDGRLEWPVTEQERNTDKGWGRFQKEQIYHIRVRKLLDDYVPSHTTPEQFNCWTVMEVLEQAVACPQLEAVLEEYKKPVILEDELLGTLELDKELDLLEGTIVWCDEEVSLMLEIDPEDATTFDLTCTVAKKLVTEQKTWDKTLRTFAAKELTALANDWQTEDNENAIPITEEIFAERISLSELSVSFDGSFTAYYDDDDMFWGHIIEMGGSVTEGIDDANIAG